MINPPQLNCRPRVKALSAALGTGVLLTMGAVTVAQPTTAVGTGQDRWTADPNLTLVPVTRMESSARPQYVINSCAWATDHMRMHHNC
ncbi:Uncharacterised protein [Mycobacteroides abscessus subsp. abscessus]|nr:Uncharacterised protein [Mycobacteroides abscessus subsp. abscessus]